MTDNALLPERTLGHMLKFDFGAVALVSYDQIVLLHNLPLHQPDRMQFYLMDQEVYATPQLIAFFPDLEKPPACYG